MIAEVGPPATGTVVHRLGRPAPLRYTDHREVVDRWSCSKIETASAGRLQPRYRTSGELRFTRAETGLSGFDLTRDHADGHGIPIIARIAPCNPTDRALARLSQSIETAPSVRRNRPNRRCDIRRISIDSPNKYQRNQPCLSACHCLVGGVQLD